MSRRKKLAAQFRAGYGKTPDVDYLSGDMDGIRSYFDMCRRQEPDAFWIDDTTWNDLDMDSVYKRINPGLSTAGEQYLYRMLRSPADPASFERQRRLIAVAENEPETRLKLQLILNRIGRKRHVDLAGERVSRRPSGKQLAIYLLLGCLLPVCALVLLVLQPKLGALLLVGTLVGNGYYHTWKTRQLEMDMDTQDTCVELLFALRRLQRLRHAGLDETLRDVYPCLARLKGVLWLGPVSSIKASQIGSMLSPIFLTDLQAYEITKGLLSKHYADYLKIHEAVGRIDAAIAAASFRQSLPVYCEPEIAFEAEKPFLHAKGVIHPLIGEPVPNDAELDGPLLITGANASGKSTYIKTALLCALLSQSLCTAPCESYKASAFRVYSSMAPEDSVQSGDSYYVAEIRSLKRILDDDSGKPVLCGIDEVLRGTNTVERIAASTEVLRALKEKGFLCVAATHDMELCALLEEDYTLAHFEETVTENEIRFDYRIRSGPATTRNAINLLRLIGFDEKITGQAHERADRYAETGKWS